MPNDAEGQVSKRDKGNQAPQGAYAEELGQYGRKQGDGYAGKKAAGHHGNNQQQVDDCACNQHIPQRRGPHL
ncbi:hypothetical protein SDC9_116827 [bioreactor metagenome]|uniref:Uncharacterized protein n=1 Tax=bioreactor metagenome TaxID=1076179 RepID=A0A645BWV8_9ZZZZ